MIQIDKLEISLAAYRNDAPDDVQGFGRVLKFASGLNLVVGDNTTGKTTLVECLFYALGMEELIEGKVGVKSLDQAVKEHFLCWDKNGNGKDWQVKESFVRLQLSNSKHETITIKRSIKSEGANRINILYVWHTPMADITKNLDSKEYFVHNQGDHNEDYKVGFYSFLADFAGLPIIQVSARNKDYTLLYMQTLFCATYIEQKRGWSDFFANIRSFNIMSPKQRLIEYIMGYPTNGGLIYKVKLTEKKKELEKTWENKVGAFQNYLAYNGLLVDCLVADLRQMKADMDDLHIVYRKNGVELDSYLGNLIKRIDFLEEKQKSGQIACKDEHYLEALRQYEMHKEEYEQFCMKLVNETDKLTNIKEQVLFVENEINRYNSLNKVNNIVTTLDVKVCPTCHQKMPLGHIHERTILTSVNIKESLEVLKTQRSFLSPIIKRLEVTISNMMLNKQYLDKQLRKEETEIKTMASINNINLNPLTISEQFELVEIKTQISSFGEVEDSIRTRKQELNAIKHAYDEVCNDFKNMQFKEDKEQPIAKQLSAFKDLLMKFGYTSNTVANSVYFKEDKRSYQYLPVISHSDGGEEEIRSDSSASDFIRSIWAYYLTLLKLGNHHPGFLVMDEPCQHSMKENSLLQLFEVCAQMKDKQVVLFCSSQPKTEESKDNEDKQEENVIETLAKSIEGKGLELNYLSIDPKAILKCNL